MTETKKSHFIFCRSLAGFRFSILTGIAAAFLLPVSHVSAQTLVSTNDDTGISSCPIGNYFSDWFPRVTRIQSEQPHWVTPLVTVTPRLEEEVRYDQYRESMPGGHVLDNYGGGKGIELIPFDPVEIIIGIPAWETEDMKKHKDGWADETFLIKYRIASANEENGNYILSAFLGLSVPNGSDAYSSEHYSFTPTLAFGKGWGKFDFQTTVGMTFPDNGSTPDGAGTPLAINTALQYHVMKYLWPELEGNYTYWPNGEHSGKNQLFVTPGVLVGRIPIWKRVGVTLGVGYQTAVTVKPLTRDNLVISARIPF